MVERLQNNTKKNIITIYKKTIVGVNSLKKKLHNINFDLHDWDIFSLKQNNDKLIMCFVPFDCLEIFEVSASIADLIVV
jgi:hypothetical protein